MSSPCKWKNPKDIMKSHSLRRSSRGTSDFKKRRSLDIRLDLFENGENIATTQDFQAVSLKRKNPFSCDQKLLVKRAHSEGDFIKEKEDSSQSRLVEPGKLLKVLAEHFDNTKTSGVHPSVVKNDEDVAMSVKTVQTTEEKPDEKIMLQSGNLPSTSQSAQIPPVDWSLKHKMRVVVDGNINLNQKYPGIDARHIHSFVHESIQESCDWNDLNLYQQIRRCCMHYIHPYIPWLRLFPRLASDFKSRKTTPLIANDDEKIVSAFLQSWSEAFSSVYQQLRGGLTPYFYLCCHQFTVLFRCQRSKSSCSMSALVSPTTRGLRELLKAEEIPFKMPNINLHKDLKSTTVKPTTSEKENNQIVVKNMEDNDAVCDNQDLGEENIFNEDNKTESEGENDDEEDEKEDHQSASKFLEDLGLDKKEFPSLEPSKVKIQREGFREIDNRPSSMLYVQGRDVHTLFNFLLNYPGCIATSGPQAGIPPTILSPCPFQGGTLVSNTVKHSTVKENISSSNIKDNESKMKVSQVLEISGPILPHHSLNVCGILKKHQSATPMRSVVSYSTHLASAAFNTSAANDEDADRMNGLSNKLLVNFDLSNRGLLDDMKELISSEALLQGAEYIKELVVSSGQFSWTT